MVSDMTAGPTQLLSIEDYLALEIQSPLRHEYVRGVTIPMTGGAPGHNELVRSLTVLLSLALKGRPFQVFVTDQRLWIPAANAYVYPDVMVTGRPIQLQTGRKDTVIKSVQ